MAAAACEGHAPGVLLTIEAVDLCQPIPSKPSRSADIQWACGTGSQPFDRVLERGRLMSVSFTSLTLLSPVGKQDVKNITRHTDVSCAFTLLLS